MTMKAYTIVQLAPVDLRQRLTDAVRKGLTSNPKRLPSFLFYDETGSRLFQAICKTHEYYPYRTEATILKSHAGDIVRALPRNVTLIELGSGDATKTRFLLRALLKHQNDLHYLPLDISSSILESSARSLSREFPALQITGLAGEYHDAFRALKTYASPPRFVLWLGSNIGNLEPSAARTFLINLKKALDPGDVILIGFDMQKSPDIIVPAYNDAAGFTAKFNKNILIRINRELGGTFRIDQFKHVAIFNAEQHRVEMYLESRTDQTVSLHELNLIVSLTRGERIHTENSYKFTPTMIDNILHPAGLQIVRKWADPQNWFWDLLCVVPPP